MFKKIEKKFSKKISKNESSEKLKKIESFELRDSPEMKFVCERLPLPKSNEKFEPKINLVKKIVKNFQFLMFRVFNRFLIYIAILCKSIHDLLLLATDDVITSSSNRKIKKIPAQNKIKSILKKPQKRESSKRSFSKSKSDSELIKRDVIKLRRRSFATHRFTALPMTSSKRQRNKRCNHRHNSKKETSRRKRPSRRVSIATNDSDDVRKPRLLSCIVHSRTLNSMSPLPSGATSLRHHCNRENPFFSSAPIFVSFLKGIIFGLYHSTIYKMADFLPENILMFCGISKLYHRRKASENWCLVPDDYFNFIYHQICDVITQFRDRIDRYICREDNQIRQVQPCTPILNRSPRFRDVIAATGFNTTYNYVLTQSRCCRDFFCSFPFTNSIIKMFPFLSQFFSASYVIISYVISTVVVAIAQFINAVMEVTSSSSPNCVKV